MSEELNQAIAHFNSNELSKAKKSLKKIKANSFVKKKLEFAILVKEGKYIKSLFLGKQLLLETKDPKEVVEIANSMARRYVDLDDAENAEYYFELSLSHDDSVANGASLIHLLTLYAIRNHLVNIEKLAPKALGWANHSIEAQMLLLENASKFGSKVLVQERSKALFRDLELLDGEQFATFIDYLNAVGMEELRDIACEKYEKKFKISMVSNKVDHLLKNGKVDEALSLLEADAHSDQAVRIQHIISKILHNKGDFAGAFKAAEKKGALRKSEDALIATHFNDERRMLAEFKGTIPKLQKKPDLFQGEEGGNHVFIFGFPRSGTTLLDNVLDTQDDLLVLSERNILTAATSLMKKFGKKYPKDIPNLSQDELDIMRKRYLEIIVDEQGFKIPESGIIIEKNPHFTDRLPLIKALFPGSKLIVNIRHPLDVCLSCLQQNFSKGIQNSHLMVFQDIVNRYVSMFELLERYERELSIDLLYVRYEDLVDDLKGEMEKVFDYIGFAPNSSYLEFHKHANEKYVTSASKGQTSQPLYQSSRYKWKKYNTELAPYFDDLRYFVNKFGYDFD